MNINIIRLAPIQKELAGIRNALERLASAYEMELAEKGLHVRAPRADTSGKEPETLYSDEELDAIREEAESSGRMTEEMRRYFYGEPEDVSPNNN